MVTMATYIANLKNGDVPTKSITSQLLLAHPRLPRGEAFRFTPFITPGINR